MAGKNGNGHINGNGSPRGEAGSPRGEAGSPRGEAGSPRGEAGSPRGEAGSPRASVDTRRGEASKNGLPAGKQANGKNGKKLVKAFKMELQLDLKSFLLYFLVFFLALVTLSSFFNGRPKLENRSISTVLSDAKAGKISEITVSQDYLTIKYKDGSQVESQKDPNQDLSQTLFSKDELNLEPNSIILTNKDDLTKNFWVDSFLQFGPIVLFFVLMAWLYKRQMRGADSLFSFGHSPAKMYSKDMPKVTFADVAGVDEAKKELEEIVDFLKNPKKYAAVGARTPKGVLLVGPSGTGKCVTGETIVWTNKGLMPIVDIPRYYYVDEETGQVFGAKLDSLMMGKIKNNDQLASHWYCLGESETLKIETTQGFTLEGTLEHPVAVLDDRKLAFKKISDLKIGDVVAIRFNEQRFGHDKSIDQDTAYLLGLLTGDGNMSISSRVALTSADGELVKFYRDYLKKRFPNIKIYEKSKYDYVVSSWEFKRYLYLCGISYLLSFDKQIPPAILQSPKEIQVAFLQGLFDTDASIDKKRPVFEYTTVSEKLARQIQALLLNLGVVPGFNVKGKVAHGYHRPVYRINITGTYLPVFAQGVGFRLTRKKKLLEEKIAQEGQGTNTNVDLFYGLGLVVDGEWRKISRAGKSNEYWSKVIHHIRTRRDISRLMLQKFLAFCHETGHKSVETMFLTNLLKANLYFVKVSLKEKSKNIVYDFTVPQTHSFIGNGFINHNTLLAKAVAGEAGVPFFSMAGSEFMEMLVGVGASRARDLFQTAKKSKPAIIFIDEIDAIGRTRSVGIIGGHDEREQTLNQILIEMDGFEPNEQVIVMAASVVGETPVMVRQAGTTKISPIGQVVDDYFSDKETEGEMATPGLETLGFERKIVSYRTPNNVYFDHSAFKAVKSVFRHRVREIYRVKYLGGEILATGSHSVFVRDRFGLHPKPVDQLQKGDVLVDLPLKVAVKENGREYRGHKFASDWKLTLPVFDKERDEVWGAKYLYATMDAPNLSQRTIAEEIGVAQTTVSLWQRGIGCPREISRKYFKHNLPEEVAVTPQLLRLMGYYVAEGYARDEVDFCFAEKERNLFFDLTDLMKTIFGLDPDHIRRTTPNAVNIVYSSSPLADFLTRHCGKGAKNKHAPEFLFTVPKEYFLEFLKGVYFGDGSLDKRGKGEITSVSQRLILELNWLCRMHGIKSYLGQFKTVEGRKIKNGKPLASGVAYRLGFGKTQNPFAVTAVLKRNATKRAVVQEVKKLHYNGFVYDLCGVDNEAFFGGESPVLLHNTNRGDLLDPALLRPGRFDRRVVLDLPDKEGRLAILKVHQKNKPFADAQGKPADATSEPGMVNWEKVAQRTVGFSGADLENMLNEAAIEAARHNRPKIIMEDLEEAATKVKMGPQKKRIQTDLDKKITAYHEAGHALVTHFLPHMDPVHRISIVSRGMSLGHTLIPPTVDRLHETRSHLVEEIASMLGGRAAENLIFKEMTTGASSDIAQATAIARDMVMEFGMSPLGPINFSSEAQMIGGRTYLEPQKLSDDMAAKIDEAVKKLIDEGYTLALKLIKKHRKTLDKIVVKLLETETLEAEQFEEIVGHKKANLMPNS